MNNLREKYPQLVIMAFPSRDFGGQEFNEAEKTRAFTDKKGVKDLILFATDHVVERPHRPVFQWVRTHAAAQGPIFAPAWNFMGKFLIDSHGNMKQTSKPLEDLADFFDADGNPRPEASFTPTPGSLDALDDSD